MVRRTALALAALVLVALAGDLAAQQPAAPAPAQVNPLRLAYINSQVILANTPGRAEAESLFAREMVGFRAEAQRLQQQLDSTIAEYNRTGLVLSPSARQTREAEIRTLQQRAQARAQELDQTAQQREAQLTAPIMQRVNAVIEGIRAEFNIAMIFDAAGQGAALVTADRSLDISPLVIQRLQAAGPSAAPARDTTAAAPPPAAASPPTAPRPTAQPAQRPTGQRPPSQRPTQPPPALRQ